VLAANITAFVGLESADDAPSVEAAIVAALLVKAFEGWP
jgi:hypothetical protein